MRAFSLLVLLWLPLTAFSQNKPSYPHAGWFKGTEEEKTGLIERQFRGFDMVMVEVGYRYQELYWAARDTNWLYAAYQTEKIETAIERGLERRPKRGPSAREFLREALPPVREAVARRDTVAFNRAYTFLTWRCNTCHLVENVPFVTIRPPVSRQSPVRN